MYRWSDLLSAREGVWRSRGWIGGRTCVRGLLFLTALIAALPASAGAASWSIQQTPNVPNASNELFGVSCTSARNCTAVGWDFTSSSTATLAERWDGASWAIQPTPNPAGSAAPQPILEDVSCTSASACTAVGSYQSAAGARGTLVERWDGTSWTIQPSPNVAQADSELVGVSCPSSNACVAVGFAGSSPLVERWNGSTWAIQSVTGPPGANAAALSGVSCTSASACTAVGQYVVGAEESADPVAEIFAGFGLPLVERLIGKTWTVQPTSSPASPLSAGGDASTFLTFPCGGLFPTIICASVFSDAGFDAASCTSAISCTAVGDYLSVAGGDLTLAEHWNGAVWLTQPTPNPAGLRDNVLSGVSCASASACTAVGDSFSFGVTFAEGWNGTKWSLQTVPTPAGASSSQLVRVSCTAAAVCMAVGHSDNPSFVTLAERYS